MSSLQHETGNWRKGRAGCELDIWTDSHSHSHILIFHPCPSTCLSYPFRRDNVTRLWDQLNEMLKTRRDCLSETLKLYRVFQEMIYVLDWIEEVKTRLSVEDVGKHFKGVEDLLQKHAMLEADIGLIGERVHSVNGAARAFLPPQGEEAWRPCEPHVIDERTGFLEAQYNELVDLAKGRKAKLLEAKRLWQLMGDMDDEEQWIREMVQLMNSPDLGHDITTVQALLNKHKVSPSPPPHLPSKRQISTHPLKEADSGHKSCPLSPFFPHAD